MLRHSAADSRLAYVRSRLLFRVGVTVFGTTVLRPVLDHWLFESPSAAQTARHGEATRRRGDRGTRRRGDRGDEATRWRCDEVTRRWGGEATEATRRRGDRGDEATRRRGDEATRWQGDEATKRRGDEAMIGPDRHGAVLFEFCRHSAEIETRHKYNNKHHSIRQVGAAA